MSNFEGEVGLTFDTKRYMFYVYKCFKIIPTYFGSCKQIKRATKKRPDTLVKVRLCKCYTPEDLNKSEKYFIKIFNATKSSIFYNIAEGGNGGNTHIGWSEERKREYSLKCSDNLKLRGLKSIKTKQKISNTLKGHFVSDNTKFKQSIAKKGKPGNARKSISLQNILTKEIVHFNSYDEAACLLKCTSSLISYLVAGKTSKIKKVWCLSEENHNDQLYSS
jgi:hypothetical protein